MEKQQLLDTLNNLIQQYQVYLVRIEKARSQTGGKFKAAVIEKVILDYEIKASEIADQVTPLLPSVGAEADALNAEQAAIEASKGSVDEVVQELELRMLIGELEADAFEQEVSDHRARQSQAEARLAAISDELGTLNGVLDTWAALAGPAGHYTAPAPVTVPGPVAEVSAPAPDPVPAPLPEPAPVVEAAPEPTPELAPEPEASGMLDIGLGAPDVAAEPSRPVRPAAEPQKDEYLSTSKIQDDVGPLAEPTPPISIRMEEEAPIETSEVNEDAQSDVQFGFDAGDLGSDLGIGDIGVSEVAPSAGRSGGEVEIDFDVNGGGEAPKAEDKGGQRRALLLYQEGTADEQIYPFTGDTLTVGRGRENDIQIKNDSKVSRYHCRISRRASNFYIEDVKSSNGTLVNGELITERRLFGGEEVIIGETFFRFRIME